jgi:hypothetical protein
MAEGPVRVLLQAPPSFRKLSRVSHKRIPVTVTLIGVMLIRVTGALRPEAFPRNLDVRRGGLQPANGIVRNTPLYPSAPRVWFT